ncbi:MAG: N-acetylmuramic acid 6-phosphate etherase [Acidobacteriota bacterium]
MGDRRRAGKRSEAASGSPWAALTTEARHPGSRMLDRMSAREAVELLLDEDRRGLELAREHAEGIARAAEWLAETLAGGHDAVLAGAGTSGRLAVLEAAECPPTFGTEPERIRAVIAGGPEAVFRAHEGAEDREDDGAAVGAELRTGDLLIGVSASSVTPYVRGALGAARGRGARTVLVTCAKPEAADRAADLVLALATGPEILTGSTRLKAGSATKAVLNAITTAAMVLLGKVYENWMVDLRTGSAKLVDRARRIVAEAGGVDLARARGALDAAGGEVKTAILVVRLGIPAGAARERLARAGGHLHRALDATGG